MNFSSTRIVLVETSHPGNIGASARAMKTMGLSRLYLVRPKLFPDLKAFEMAAGADDLLTSCVIVDSLQDALGECQLVIATSARQRGISLPELSPRECASLVGSQADNTETAIVFGRERTGLTNEELMHCHFQVLIPANPDYSSLNLAQAVQIIAYEFRILQAAMPQPLAKEQEIPATTEEIEKFYQHLTEVLFAIKFLKPENLARVQTRIRRLFNRIRLERMEVNILRGVLSHIQKSIRVESNT